MEQNIAILVHEPDAHQYVLHTEDYSGIYGPIILDTFFKYNGQDSGPFLKKAREHSLARAKALGVNLEDQSENVKNKQVKSS